MSTVFAFIAVLVSGVVDLSSFMNILPSLFMILTVPIYLVIAAPSISISGGGADARSPLEADYSVEYLDQWVC
jgi:hypothetical protein